VDGFIYVSLVLTPNVSGIAFIAAKFDGIMGNLQKMSGFSLTQLQGPDVAAVYAGMLGCR
jgi:hypothetical protein